MEKVLSDNSVKEAELTVEMMESIHTIIMCDGAISDDRKLPVTFESIKQFIDEIYQPKIRVKPSDNSEGVKDYEVYESKDHPENASGLYIRSHFSGEIICEFVDNDKANEFCQAVNNYQSLKQQAAFPCFEKNGRWYYCYIDGERKNQHSKFFNSYDECFQAYNQWLGELAQENERLKDISRELTNALQIAHNYTMFMKQNGAIGEIGKDLSIIESVIEKAKSLNP